MVSEPLTSAKQTLELYVSMIGALEHLANVLHGAHVVMPHGAIFIYYVRSRSLAFPFDIADPYPKFFRDSLISWIMGVGKLGHTGVIASYGYRAVSW
jgi:hypothetical protein